MSVNRRKTDTSYKGMELNENNVQLIFQNSITTIETPENDRLSSILFSRTGGFSPEEEEILYFSKNKILQNQKHIAYLLGQLKNAHTPSEDSHLSIQDAFIDYTGKKWTKNNAILLELLYLGAVDGIDCIAPFTKNTGSAIFVTDIIKPTLSPKDPNYPTWFEEHKSEWNPKKETPEGPEGH